MANPSLHRVMRHIRQLAGPRSHQSRDHQRPEAQRSDRELLARFINEQDEAAFAGLVRRHGPLVRGVCQRLLDQDADRDDAFQATFLVLLHKARSIRKRHSVGSWLYGVAYRIALKARSNAARRRLVSSPVSPRGGEVGRIGNPSYDPSREAAWRELCAILDEELQRLSDRYRSPLVLCYLAGQTQEEAAGHLGWSLRTLKRRLEQGKEVLRLRLSRRGLTLSSTLLIAGLSQQEAAAAVPLGLTLATIKEASLVAAGKTASTTLSANTLALTHGALKSLALGKLKSVVVCVLLASLAAAGAGFALQQIAAPKTSQDKLEIARQQQPPTSAPAAAKLEKPVRTDRYGDPLPPHALQRLGTVRFRHGQQIYSVAYSPDGKLIASGGLGSIRLWEAASGKPVASLTAHKRHVFSLMFSKDSKKLVSVGVDEMEPHPGTGKLILWDVANRRAIFTVKHNGWVRTAAISSNGKNIAMGCDDGTLILLDGESGKELHSLGQSGRFVQTVAFSPDARTFAATGDDNSIQVWDASTGQKLSRLSDAARLRALAYSSDGEFLASAHDSPDSLNGDSVIYLWNLTTRKKQQTLRAHQGTIFSVAFSPDNKLLASGGMHGLVLIWDLSPGDWRAGEEGPDAEKLQQAWVDLKSSASTRAFRARWTLGFAPEAAVALLKERLYPVQAAKPDRLQRLLAGLDSKQFVDREQAQKELDMMGELAAPALRKALAEKPSLEVRRRIESLLDKLHQSVTRPDTLRALRALAVLEDIATGQARQVLENLATGAPEARLTQEAKAALARLQVRADAQKRTEEEPRTK